MNITFMGDGQSINYLEGFNGFQWKGDLKALFLILQKYLNTPLINNFFDVDSKEQTGVLLSTRQDSHNRKSAIKSILNNSHVIIVNCDNLSELHIECLLNAKSFNKIIIGLVSSWDFNNPKYEELLTFKTSSFIEAVYLTIPFASLDVNDALPELHNKLLFNFFLWYSFVSKFRDCYETQKEFLFELIFQSFSKDTKNSVLILNKLEIFESYYYNKPKVTTATSLWGITLPSGGGSINIPASTAQVTQLGPVINSTKLTGNKHNSKTPYGPGYVPKATKVNEGDILFADHNPSDLVDYGGFLRFLKQFYHGFSIYTSNYFPTNKFTNLKIVNMTGTEIAIFCRFMYQLLNSV